MKSLKVAVIGAGYFSQFHYDAWSRIGDVELVGLCDVDRARDLQFPEPLAAVQAGKHIGKAL